MKYIFVLLTLLSTNIYAEDCLDREDDRWAHEYYSNRYEANRERRRHSNDYCNDMFEMRNKIKLLEMELEIEKSRRLNEQLEMLNRTR